MRQVALLSFFLCVGTPVSSRAQFTAEELYDWCTQTSDANDLYKEFHGYGCLMYIRGVVDTFRMMHDAHKLRAACLPKQGITPALGVRVFTKWLEFNPNERTISAHLAVILALRDRYPCGPEPRPESRPKPNVDQWLKQKGELL